MKTTFVQHFDIRSAKMPKNGKSCRNLGDFWRIRHSLSYAASPTMLATYKGDWYKKDWGSTKNQEVWGAWRGV